MKLQPTRRAQRAARLLAAPALAALAISACGSSSSSTTQSAGSSSSGLSQAKAFAAQYESRPTKIPVTQPVGQAIPTGKKIDFILCGVQSCQDLAKDFTAGATALGWTVNEINTKGTPQTVQAAWEQAVRDHPDAVVASGFPRAVFAQQLAQLQAANIPVVESSVDDTVGGGINLIVSTPQQSIPDGQMMAAWVVADSGGQANTVYFDLPAFNILEPILGNFKTSYAQWCSGCPLDVVNVPVTAIGKDVPERVASYLRAHPNVNEVAFSLGLLNAGVPQALQALGLSSKVHIVVDLLDAVNAQYIAAGQTQAATVYATNEVAWTEADTLARLFTNQSIAPDVNAQLPWWLVTKDNLGSTTANFPLVADYQSQFKALWGVG